MKKKLLFMVINMNVGGTEKALLNMISELPKEDYDITILMLEEYGGFLNSIPKEINVEYLREYNKIKDYLNNSPRQVILKNLKKIKIVKSLILCSIYLLSKLAGERTLLLKYLLRKIPIFEKRYDLAVAYAGPMDLISYFIAHKVRAKKKIQWIHFDITKINFNKKLAYKVYSHFNQIFVVSKEGKNKFLEIFSESGIAIDSFYNIISAKSIVQKANDGYSFDDDFTGQKILTVGRLSAEKGQDITIKVLAKLKKRGYNVRWYCIGDGSMRKTYEDLIKKYELENDYILLGSLHNPYPYMKDCNIYVQSSRHEGYCITLSEARCFDNPIITTSFTGAAEQIRHEVTGLIVDPTEEDLYEGIVRLLEEEELTKEIKRNLKMESISTSPDLKKLKEFI